MVDTADLSRLRIAREEGRAAPSRGGRRWWLVGLGVVVLAAAAVAAFVVVRDRGLEVRTATAVGRGGGSG
ncbi:MAG: hypothetical protein IRZ00_20765, partial [Gemmatimonadetes bacterium]|nr:hypothetical protein [Gemmatimonadota bacterium]